MILWWIACTVTKDLEQEDTSSLVGHEEIFCEGDGPVLDSSVGCLEGINHQNISMFLGVPYAEPPIGALRWKRPQPISSWDTVQRFDTLSEPCVQSDGNGGFLGSEDCLTLNIFRPSSYDETEKLPIMFFTHGGSFVSGMGSSEVLDAPPELGKKAIVVTHNYRLGPLGFMAHEGLSNEDAEENGGIGTSGNLGVFDTLVALKWVYDNAQVLGGDSEQIMIFGESAGGISTCLLLVTSESEGLFSSAMVQSGACTAVVEPLEVAQEQGAAYEEALGCAESEDPIACMREASFQEVMSADISSDFGFEAGFSPNVDGVLIEKATGTMLYEGDFHRVPMAAGVNANEGSMFIHYLGLDSSQELEDMLREYAFAFGISDVDTLISLYTTEEFGDAQSAMDQFYGDLFFVCPTRLSLDMISFYTPTYAYYYSHVPSWIPAYPYLDGWGSYHSSELPFVFGTYLSFLTSEEQQFSEQMMNTWVNFAKEEYSTDGAGEWLPYGEGISSQTDGGQWLSLRPNDFQMVAGVRRERCDFMFSQWFSQ